MVFFSWREIIKYSYHKQAPPEDFGNKVSDSGLSSNLENQGLSFAKPLPLKQWSLVRPAARPTSRALRLGKLYH